MIENRISSIGKRLEIIFVNGKEKRKNKKDNRKRIINVPGAETTTDGEKIRYVRKICALKEEERDIPI